MRHFKTMQRTWYFCILIRRHLTSGHLCICIPAYRPTDFRPIIVVALRRPRAFIYSCVMRSTFRRSNVGPNGNAIPQCIGLLYRYYRVGHLITMVFVRLRLYCISNANTHDIMFKCALSRQMVFQCLCQTFTQCPGRAKFVLHRPRSDIFGSLINCN